jgi:diguanylate cyclase (GGDEF)-like protein
MAIVSISDLRRRKGAVRDAVSGSAVCDTGERPFCGGRLQPGENRDPSTGLLTRIPFENRLRAELARVQRGGGGFALCLLDIDNFGFFNGLYGYSAGDLLVQIVAGVIRTRVYEANAVARLERDRFGVFLKGVTRQEIVQRVVREILATLRNGPAREDGRVAQTVSIGVSLCPCDGIDQATLWSRAEYALFQTKAQGGDGYRFFQEQRGSPVLAAPAGRR